MTTTINDDIELNGSINLLKHPLNVPHINHLITHGWTLVTNVLGETDLNDTINDIQLYDGVNYNEHGVAINCGAHLDGVWKCRSIAKDFFDKIWFVNDQNNGLVTSFESFRNGQKVTLSNTENINFNANVHSTVPSIYGNISKNKFRSEMYCPRAIFHLAGECGFVFVEGSHKKECNTIIGKQLSRIDCMPGDMIIFDSRLCCGFLKSDDFSILVAMQPRMHKKINVEKNLSLVNKYAQTNSPWAYEYNFVGDVIKKYGNNRVEYYELIA